MGSLSVFDRQLRLSWWDQKKIEETSVFLVADNPLAYLAVLGLVAVGYGRIYVFGSSNVYRYKILFDEYTGLFPDIVARFVYKYLSKYLENYALEIEPINVNIVSDRALNLFLRIADIDDKENKILIDMSSSYRIKYLVGRAIMELEIPSYIFAPYGEGAKLYVVDLDRDKKGYQYIAKAYTDTIRYSAIPLPLGHLFLLFVGLILGEATMRIQEPPKEYFVPTNFLEFPLKGLGTMRGHVGLINKVAVVGCGALGTFYTMQLAILQNMQMLKIRKIVFVDPDDVELVNFNRQLLFWGDTIGEPKAKVMAERYKNMVYDKVQTEYFVARFDEISEKLSDADLIIEGVDNWAARKEIARFAVKNKIPLISSGVEVFGGHTTYYIPNKTYCPFHSMDLENKHDPPGREGCLVIEPSVIFTNITLASLGILNALVMEPPLNGVLYYSLTGLYGLYKRFHLERFYGSCGD